MAGAALFGNLVLGQVLLVVVDNSLLINRYHLTQGVIRKAKVGELDLCFILIAHGVGGEPVAEFLFIDDDRVDDIIRGDFNKFDAYRTVFQPVQGIDLKIGGAKMNDETAPMVLSASRSVRIEFSNLTGERRFTANTSL
jgi:hypothetical protein